jgi:hypothetical protein
VGAWTVPFSFPLLFDSFLCAYDLLLATAYYDDSASAKSTLNILCRKGIITGVLYSGRLLGRLRTLEDPTALRRNRVTSPRSTLESTALAGRSAFHVLSFPRQYLSPSHCHALESSHPREHSVGCHCRCFQECQADREISPMPPVLLPAARTGHLAVWQHIVQDMHPRTTLPDKYFLSRDGE